MSGIKKLFINKSSGDGLYSSFPRDRQSCQQSRHHQPGWGRSNTQGFTALAGMTVHGEEALMPAKYQTSWAKMLGLNLT